MAIIYTYPTKATLALADLTLISDSADANKTKQATMASIKDVINVVDSAASGSGISITGEGSGPYTGAITIANTGVLSFSNAFGTYITGTTNTSVTGNASIGTLDLSAIDGVDTSNRFLSKDNVWSTVIGVVGPGTANKIPKFATTTTLGDSIMAEQAAAGVFASSYIEISGSGGLSTQDLEINAALWDGSASKGTIGQLLSSNGTETTWIEPPAASTQGKIQYNNLGNLAGSTNMTFTDSGVTALFQVRNIVQVRAGNSNAGTIKLWSGDDLKHVDLLGPITGADDYAIRMPASLGTANQVLKLPSTIPGSGASQLAWGDATGSGGVSSFTNTNGTFISAGTANSAATGAVTMGTIDLSATGTAGNTTFLRGDNQWVIPTNTTNIALTTTGTSGASTWNGTTLNIPQYSGGGSAAAGGQTPVDYAVATDFETTGGNVQYFYIFTCHGNFTLNKMYWYQNTSASQVVTWAIYQGNLSSATLLGQGSTTATQTSVNSVTMTAEADKNLNLVKGNTYVIGHQQASQNGSVACLTSAVSNSGLAVTYAGASGFPASFPDVELTYTATGIRPCVSLVP